MDNSSQRYESFNGGSGLKLLCLQKAIPTERKHSTTLESKMHRSSFKKILHVAAFLIRNCGYTLKKLGRFDSDIAVAAMH